MTDKRIAELIPYQHNWFNGRNDLVCSAKESQQQTDKLRMAVKKFIRIMSECYAPEDVTISFIAKGAIEEITGIKYTEIGEE